MGHLIVYCDDCGERILEEHLSKGKAHQEAGRYFCSKCRPMTPSMGTTPSQGTRAPTPPRIPSSATGITKVGTTRRAPAMSAPSSKTPMIVGGVIAGAALVGLLVFALSGGDSKSAEPQGSTAGTPVPKDASSGGTPKNDAQDERRKIFEEVEKFVAANPDKPQAVIDRCKDAIPKLLGTPWETKVREFRIRAEDKQKEAGADTKVDETLAEAKKIADGDPNFLRKTDVRGCYDLAKIYAAGVSRLLDKVTLAHRAYEKSFSETATRVWKKVYEEAEKIVAEKKDYEAAGRHLSTYPEQYREGEWSRQLEEARADYERRGSAATVKPAIWEDFQRAMKLFEEDKYKEGVALLDDVFKRASDPETVRREGLTEQQLTQIAQQGYYNAACYFSREEKNAEQACRCLTGAINAGYSDWDHIDKDKDFDPIRDSEPFKKLMKIARGRKMGVNCITLSADEVQKLGLGADQGAVRVEKVLPNTVAEKGGMKVGDVILEIDKKQLPAKETFDRMREFLNAAKDDADIPVVVLRDSKKVTLKLKWAKK